MYKDKIHRKNMSNIQLGTIVKTHVLDAVPKLGYES